MWRVWRTISLEAGMDMRFLMKQAQQMQAKLLEAQQGLRAVGTAGGESVKITVNGAKELVGISIAKEAIDPEDPSMLEDLIMAAFSDASAKAAQAMAEATGSMASGLNIPGLPGLSGLKL
jgi:DNA-binding YbaB/EbfC family protein